MRDASRLQWLLGFVLAITCSSLAGCARSPAEPPTTPPTPVRVSYPVERDVNDFADFTGRTAAVESVEVRARVSGYLEQVAFKEGALVKKGDLLFVIDPRPFVAELNRAQAQREQAQAGVTQSTAQLAQAQALKNKAAATLDYARRRLERSKNLVAGNVVSKDEFELHLSEMLEAQADLEGAQAELAASQAAIVTAKAAVTAAEAAIGIAELNLEYTKVTAPVDGRVSRELVTEGNFVQPGENPGGTLLTTIVSVDPMYAYFDVDEQTVLRVRKLIREGKARSARDTEISVTLALANEDGFPHQGTINFVDNQINPKTGTLRLRGVFSNENEALAPGYFVRVRVPIGEPYKALLVSERALDSDQGQRIVYVVNAKNEVTARPVRLGALHDGLRVIEEGVRPGERIMVTGLLQVRPGAVVEPKLVEMPVASARKRDAMKSMVQN